MLLDPSIGYYGCVPNVGDVLTHWGMADLFGHFRVIGRQFIEARGNDCGWALFVEAIKDEMADAMLATWPADTWAFRRG